MDTRAKIVPLEELVRRAGMGEWRVVVGLFDPLTAAQAERVAEIARGGGALMAIVIDDPDTLLDAAARATLVAALRDVDLVAVTRDGEWAGLFDSLRVTIFEDAAAEKRRSDEFVEFVLRRQG